MVNFMLCKLHLKDLRVYRKKEGEGEEEVLSSSSPPLGGPI